MSPRNPMHRIHWILAVAWLAFAAGPASAHALGAECRVVGARVEVAAFYDDNTPAGNARVAVRDASRGLVAEGRTDARGRWSFDRPAAGRYEITVDAGGGHRTTVKVTVPEAAPAADQASAGNQRGGEAAQPAEVVSEG